MSTRRSRRLRRLKRIERRKQTRTPDRDFFAEILAEDIERFSSQTFQQWATGESTLPPNNNELPIDPKPWYVTGAYLHPEGFYDKDGNHLGYYEGIPDDDGSVNDDHSADDDLPRDCEECEECGGCKYHGCDCDVYDEDDYDDDYYDDDGYDEAVAAVEERESALEQICHEDADPTEEFLNGRLQY